MASRRRLPLLFVLRATQLLWSAELWSPTTPSQRGRASPRVRGRASFSLAEYPSLDLSPAASGRRARVEVVEPEVSQRQQLMRPLARERLYTRAVEYEWDAEKDRANREKHGISFAEASTVFLDPLAATVVDERHSPIIEELRFRTIGYTATERLVLVAHTDRDDRIRIISARDATPRERRQYEQQT